LNFLEGRRRDQEMAQGNLSGQGYSKALLDFKDLSNRVFQVFDQYLKPNTDFELEGHFTSGPRLDVERAIKAMNGLLPNLRVFQRKVEPAAKDYRFSLLLDASGSMADGGPRQRGGLGLAALFVDVFERLGIPYGLDVFNDSFVPLKGFSARLSSTEDRNRLFNGLKSSVWGRGGTNLREGLQESLKKITSERSKNPREREFLFVLTDGMEYRFGNPTLRQVCEEAMKKGIIVVGIGIGEGMQTVSEHFPIHLIEKNPENLPRLLAEFIKEYVRKEEE
jgi:hypothetical protein